MATKKPKLLLTKKQKKDFEKKLKNTDILPEKGNPSKTRHTKQSVIDWKNWKLATPSTQPESFEHLVQQNKLLQDTPDPGLPSKNFKSQMKPVKQRNLKDFLAKFNFKPKKTSLDHIAEKITSRIIEMIRGAKECDDLTLVMFTGEMIQAYIDEATNDDPTKFTSLLTLKSVPAPEEVDREIQQPDEPLQATVEEERKGIYQHAYGNRPEKEPHKDFHGKSDFTAGKFGLEDKWHLKALELYLEANGDYSAVQIDGNGACLFESIWRMFSFADDEEGKGAYDCDTDNKRDFTPYRLRLMTVYLLLVFSIIDQEFYMDTCRNIAGDYGWVNKDGSVDPPGPFCFKTYLEYLMQPTSWGDANCINVLATFWEAKIVVVQASDKMIKETRFKCKDCPLSDVDFVLIYNGSTHYSVAIRNSTTEGRFLKCAPLQYTADDSFSWPVYALDPDPKLSNFYKDIQKNVEIEYRVEQHDKQSQAMIDKLRDENRRYQEDLDKAISQSRLDEALRQVEEMKKKLEEERRKHQGRGKGKGRGKKKDQNDDDSDDEAPEAGGVQALTDQISQEVLKKVITSLKDANIDITPRKERPQYNPPAAHADLPFDSKETVCRECKINFRENRTLEMHWRFYHNGEEGELCMEKDERGHFCLKEFINTKGLHLHIQRAHTDKDNILECDECPVPESGQKRTYSSKQALVQHKKDRHSGHNAINICKFCKRNYTLLRDWKEHVSGCPKNPDRNKFYCDFPDCDKVFGWLKYLREHKKKKHPSTKKTPTKDEMEARFQKQRAKVEEDKKRKEAAIKRMEDFFAQMEGRAPAPADPDSPPPPPPPPAAKAKGKKPPPKKPKTTPVVQPSFSSDEEEDNVEQQRPKTPPPPPPAPPANTGKGKKPRKKPKTPKFVTPSFSSDEDSDLQEEEYIPPDGEWEKDEAQGSESDMVQDTPQPKRKKLTPRVGAKTTAPKAATPKAATPKAATPKAATPKAATPKAVSKETAKQPPARPDESTDDDTPIDVLIQDQSQKRPRRGNTATPATHAKHAKTSPRATRASTKRKHGANTAPDDPDRAKRNLSGIFEDAEVPPAAKKKKPERMSIKELQEAAERQKKDHLREAMRPNDPSKKDEIDYADFLKQMMEKTGEGRSTPLRAKMFLQEKAKQQKRKEDQAELKKIRDRQLKLIERESEKAEKERKEREEREAAAKKKKEEEEAPTRKTSRDLNNRRKTKAQREEEEKERQEQERKKREEEEKKKKEKKGKGRGGKGKKK